MIDLHTHILPGIDDGADSVEEAIQLTEILYNQNIRKAVCTPHFNPSRTTLEEFLIKRKVAMNLMGESKIALLSGSETFLHEYLFHYPDLSQLCIENTRYLLIELPFGTKWSDKIFEQLMKLINYYNVIPIIAHVERYKNNRNTFKKLKQMNCAIQLNTSSILDKKTSQQAIRYIKLGYVDVLGSDCHNIKTRLPIISDALAVIVKALGINYCNNLEKKSELVVDGRKLDQDNPHIIDT